MKTSQRGIDLIKQHEGCCLTAYPDPVTGDEPWTIGYGTTHGVHKGMKITLPDAEAMLVASLPIYEVTVAKALHVKVTQEQFDAMVSLCYNIGSRSFLGSSVLRHVNEGDYVAAGDAFLMWDKGHTPKGFVVIPGLLARRRDERNLFRGNG